VVGVGSPDAAVGVGSLPVPVIVGVDAEMELVSLLPDAGEGTTSPGVGAVGCAPSVQDVVVGVGDGAGGGIPQ
jgi:hypothetical protein